MRSEFYLECKSFINENLQGLSFKKPEGLLWIYLQIYYYNLYPQNTPLNSKKTFLDYLDGDHHFNSYLSGFTEIPEEFYNEVHKKILSRFSFKKIGDLQEVALKEFEILFEGALQNNLRSKTGTYYTPAEIVDLMVNRGILATVKEGKQQKMLQAVLDHKSINLEEAIARKLITHLEGIKVIDIACGGGVFLREALKTITEALLTLYSLLGVRKQTVEIKELILNNIYGIDLQEDTVALCKLLLLMEINKGSTTEAKDYTLNILAADGLLTDEINQRKLEGEFDLVIGNPPYIGEKGNKRIFEEIKKTSFGDSYYESKMDYFYFFIYRGYQLLKQEGTLIYITTNYFVTADGGQKLRAFFRKHMTFRWLVNFNEVNLFKEAKGQHNLIFLAEKTKKSIEAEIIHLGDKTRKLSDIHKALNGKEVKGVVNSKVFNVDLYDERGNIVLYQEKMDFKLQKKLLSVSTKALGELCNINQGMVSGADRLSTAWGNALGLSQNIGKGIFVLKEAEVKEKALDHPLYKNFLKDFYKNSDIVRYSTKTSRGLKILYLDDEYPKDIIDYPALYNHLKEYKTLLMERREVKKGTRKWYALQWPRSKKIFEGKKLLVPQRANVNSFAYHEGPWYASADVYYITLKDESNSIFYLLGILNSSVIYYWLYHRGKKKGEYLELYSTPLKSIPICYTDDLEVIKEIERTAYQLTFGNLDQDQFQQCYHRIDQLVFELYRLEEEEIYYIKDFCNAKIKIGVLRA
ncbi:Eco57I restriction-modification methylase domain-containing protein [Alkaliphilus serpentinus]|uniref:site-specific DNA-methyltransferase (adenine-specific) n=1 Tax=Alkaliphilus serpentinus TaxID=1482731 RepID=A0A833M8E4_9FIRM|nr:N-6 DNA methylase [Alkaliphilus serpentinus]KAB3530726.1 N-6 DNA methylase [Alkaliphilus serpentinus]